MNDEEISEHQISQGSPSHRSTLIACDTANNFRQFIRVNVHWVQSDAGTGNFRANDDGNGNALITGYTKAEEMINGANADLLANQKMWLPAGNTLAELPIGIGFILNGVYFDKSSAAGSANNSDWTVHTQFGKDVANTLNIYMIEANAYNGGGIANQFSFTSPPGPAVKIYGTWNIYNVFSNGWNDFQIRLLQHEIGHNLSLFHTWSGSDLCDDTPNNNNCWAFNTAVQNCDTWAEVSNNIMDYNSYEPAYTPCQIQRLTTEINSTRGTNYVYNCNDCIPANANFTMGTQYCGTSPIGMDCRGSYQENNYFIEIYKTTSTTSINVINGSYFSQWFTGQAPLISNLRSMYTPGFGNGVYRVKLAVQNFRANNQACNAWDEEVKYFTSFVNTNCTPGSGKTDEEKVEAQSVENVDFLVYPNPNNGSMVVTLGQPDFEKCKLSILDNNGSIVFQREIINDGNPIHCDIKQGGMYLVKVDKADRSIVKSILVNQ